MKPLLWKEMHDLRGWLLAGFAVTGAVELLLLTKVFDPSFIAGWMIVLMPLTAAIVAIGMAVGQIASERHNRTLDFLLARPVSPAVIVWSKFIAGSAVLALLMPCIVALGYTDPQFTSEEMLRAIREQVGMGQLLVTLLPRFWFIYALALFFSVLVDRSVKAAALAGVVAISLAAVVAKFADLAPFSGFVYWLPCFDGAGGLVDAAKSPWLSGMTGLAYSAGALLVTAASARLLQRSPEPVLGNRGLTVAAAVVMAVAVASLSAAAYRLPARAPIGSWELPAASESGPVGIVASGNLVAVSLDKHVRFLDVSQPARPRQIADVEIPLWNALSDWAIDRAAMENGTVFLVGQKKQLPVDEVEIAVVTPAGLAEPILLGPVRPGDYASTPVPAGGIVYVGVTRDRVCSLLSFDLSSRRQVGSLLIDRLRPPEPGRKEGAPPVRMLRRGTWLYVSSPSYLTAIDIADPGRPRVASQLQVRPKVNFLYIFPRYLAWQDNRLFETRMWPVGVASYDLSDPAHPVARAELTYHGSVASMIAGSGQNLYLPWQAGVLEFRAVGDDLRAQRYLDGDKAVSALATAGDYVYTLTDADKQKRRRVQAFLVEKL